MLGVYVHIPFCAAICGYCNFNRGLLDESLKRRYVDALAQEIARAGVGRAADTVFFGGGTPSLLEPAEVARLVTACREAFTLVADAEITLEANPETLTPGRLEGFLDAGITRLSVGVQSFDDRELARLGRIHSAARASDAIRRARAAGFQNVSLDLMLWLPGQSPASWRQSVDHAISLGPNHLSLYLLELYPNAPLKETMARRAASPAPEPDWTQTTDDEAADMYLDGLARLDAAGYAQYEISNVSRPGFESRHNLKYWQAGAWWGFGCGAHSTVDGVRWQNVAGTADYVDRVTAGRPVAQASHSLPADRQIEEALFTGLRLTSGIDRGNFRSRYGVDPWSTYGQSLAPCVQDGLMWMTGTGFGLTRRGMLVANEILTAFV